MPNPFYFACAENKKPIPAQRDSARPFPHLKDLTPGWHVGTIVQDLNERFCQAQKNYKILCKFAIVLLICKCFFAASLNHLSGIGEAFLCFPIIDGFAKSHQSSHPGESA